MSVKKIAFFASGSGSNFENIVNYLKEKEINVEYQLYCNKSDAYAIKRAEKLNIPHIVFNREDFRINSKVLSQLKEFNPDLIVLAGFLWLMPENIVKSFPSKIINIHPALLPAYGGKGMYGMHVHEAVIKNQDHESGITIHYVNEHYDEGEFIIQARCEVSGNDSPDELAKKIHALEYEHFPKVVEKLILKN